MRVIRRSGGLERFRFSQRNMEVSPAAVTRAQRPAMQQRLFRSGCILPEHVTECRTADKIEITADESCTSLVTPTHLGVGVTRPAAILDGRFLIREQHEPIGFHIWGLMKSNVRIAIVSASIASDVNPMLPVATTLLRRGHRVTFATSGPFVPRVARLGVEVIEYRYVVMTARGQDRNSYCRLAINALASVRAFYGAERPDLVIYDMHSLAGPVLAHHWRVPRIRVSPWFALDRRALDMQLTHPSVRALVFEQSARADEFLNEHGTPSNDYAFAREKLNIHTLPRDCDPGADLVDDSCLYAGRCAGEQVPFGDWRPISYDKPIALVAASKTFVPELNYFRLCIEAFSGLPWHIVLSIDDDTDPSSFLPLPENFEIVQKTSHTRVLPYASLLVFMGGAGTSNEAAYHGVPLVMLTMGVAELEAWADNLTRLGLGIHLKGAVQDTSQLRQAILEVTGNSSILENVRSLQHRVRREAGAEEAANRIEDVVDAHI